MYNIDNEQLVKMHQVGLKSHWPLYHSKMNKRIIRKYIKMIQNKRMLAFQSAKNIVPSLHKEHSMTGNKLICEYKLQLLSSFLQQFWSFQNIIINIGFWLSKKRQECMSVLWWHGERMITYKHVFLIKVTCYLVA